MRIVTVFKDVARVSVKTAAFWKLIPYSVVELCPEDGKSTLVNS